MTRALLAVAVGAAALAALPSPAYAAHEELVVTGLTQTDKLVTFVAGSGERLSQVKVRGVEAGQHLVAIDYRPATGGLYGVAVDGTSGYLYTLDPSTGQAVRVGTTGFPAAGDVSIDFNPTVDRLRVVSSAGDNLRVNPVTGARGDVPTNDGRLTYGVVDAAYTNNDTDPTTGTALVDIDAVGDQLVRQDPPNAGTLSAIGALGVDVDGATGFDVYSEKLSDGTTRNIALLSRRTDDGTLLHVVNLTTGAVASAAGVRAQGAPVVDIAVSPAQ
jgi:hypothetical protein